MEEDDDYVEYVPVAKRRAMQAQNILQQKGKYFVSSSSSSFVGDDASEAKPSLLVKASQLKKEQPEISATEQILQQEQEMLDNLPDRKTLLSVRELAKGITYSEPLPTGWKPPLRLRTMPKRETDLIRKQWHIIVDGEDVPCPVKNFKDMRFPDPILNKLRAKGILQPTFRCRAFLSFYQEEI
ncbi:hypothetical protein S245_025181 [Arachis hypogaea]